MELLMKSYNKTLVVSVIGDIDHHNAIQIRDKIDKRIQIENTKNIVFDFSKVLFMDSSGIGMIIGRYKLLEKKQGVVSVCCMGLSVKKIFDVSGLAKIINVYDSVNEAVTQIQ